MSQKYVIVHFIDKSTVPEEFSPSEWPLHVTLLANFTLGQPLERLIDELARYASGKQAYDIAADGEAQFGRSRSVAVSLIRPDEAIVAMHRDLKGITAALGAVYDEPAYMDDGYRPHATTQAAARLTDKQVVTLDDFTLVDMYPGEDITRRRIIQTFRLGGNAHAADI